MDTFREQGLILFSTPIYLIIISLELLLSHLQHQKAYTLKDTFTNIYLMLLNAGLDLCCRALLYFGVLQFFYTHAVYTWHHGFVYWLMLFIAEDFMYYWLHRFDHEIRFFWAVHVTHHSSEKLNFSVGFRSSVFQPVYRFIYFIPLAFAGFNPLDIALVYAITQIWGIFLHTELIHKMGWLEYILVTPSHHRVHHASNPKYLDKNMGMFLIIWDKMFGTFQPELPAQEYQPIKYGLTSNLQKPNAVNIIFHEWQAIFKDVFRKDITLAQRFNYIFGPPGYSHDGSRQTSLQMEIAENEASVNNNKEIPITEETVLAYP